MANAAVLKELAPTGKLRLAIDLHHRHPHNSRSRMVIATAVSRLRLVGRSQQSSAFHLNHPASGLGRNTEFSLRKSLGCRVSSRRRGAQEVRRLRQCLSSVAEYFPGRTRLKNTVGKGRRCQRHRYRRCRQYRDIPRRQEGDRQRHPHRFYWC